MTSKNFKDRFNCILGVLPGEGETVNVVLVKGNEYKPSTDGALVYLNAGNDLQPILSKIEQHGGQESYLKLKSVRKWVSSRRLLTLKEIN